MTRTLALPRPRLALLALLAPAAASLALACAQPPTPPRTTPALAVARATDAKPSAPVSEASVAAIGQPLRGFALEDCDGKRVSLASLAGPRGLWIFAAHGWCPGCQRVSKAQEVLAAPYVERGVSAVNILVKSPDDEPPTPADCKAWRDQNGLRRVVTLRDPSFVARELWNDGDNGTALSVLVDRRGVVRSKVHGMGPALVSALDGIADAPGE